jgi:Zn-dependent M28 family amino/carboxypeptidase
MRRICPSEPWGACCRLLLVVLLAANCRADDAVLPVSATVAPPASNDAKPLPITAEGVRPHIEHLASPELRGRRDADALEAAEYIAETFREAGLRPLFGEEFLQPILGSSRKTPVGATRQVIGHNVGAWIEGSDPELRDEFVMITAHFDHLGMSGGEHHPGADDNASGVSMVLQTARVVAEMPLKPRRSVVFVGFDLEEQLLWGSRWFAAHPPWEIEQVKLFLTADMIGRSLGDLPLPTVFVLGSERAPALREVLDEVECPQGLELLRLGADLIGTRSDYGPFRDRQVPFLFFSTGEHGDYHTPRDTPDKVDCEKVARISTLILRVALQVADADEPPEWNDEIVPDLDEARTVHRITELVLEADTRGEYSLNGFQRLFVDQVHAKTGNALRLGRLTSPERTWLTRAAQLLLLSVF